MGQVIKVDFAAQTSKAKQNTGDPSSIPAPMVIPLNVGGAGESDTPMITKAGSPTVSDSQDLTVHSVATANAAGDDSLVDACAHMRADTAALRDAVENLRRATADLHRLPALARELWEAVV
jgi:hypothetical protein